ncbi:hypothetical protein ACI8CA_001097 [Salmonella enterica]
MARPASRKAVSSLPAIANIDEQLDEVVMKILIGSYLVNASYGTFKEEIIGVFDDDALIKNAADNYEKKHSNAIGKTKIIEVEVNKPISE